jgi:hypothetical protein
MARTRPREPCRWSCRARSTKYLRENHALCDEYEDVATASLIENWIDESERRTWFLFEATRR